MEFPAPPAISEWRLSMNLQKCEALLKAIELGSISRAADQMGYTQSAVSRMIADLESEWDMELLRRSRSGITISSAGQQLLPILRAISADCAQLKYTVNEMHGLHIGLIRVGTFTSIADQWIPKMLTSFQGLYPNIEFELINSEIYSDIEEWILRGKVDCGFVSLPTVNDLNTRFLRRDMLVAVLPENHPQANAETFPIEALEGAPYIMIKEEDDYEIRRFLDSLPYRPKLRFEVSSDHTTLAMVESGLGISIMHSLMADNGRYRVVWKPFDNPQYRSVGIATAKNARLASITKFYIDHVCTYFAFA